MSTISERIHANADLYKQLVDKINDATEQELSAAHEHYRAERNRVTLKIQKKQTTLSRLSRRS